MAVGVVACGDAPEFQFGQNITGLQFEFFDAREGIYPSTIVLQNPRNPFRFYAIGQETTKWDILAGGGNAASFYAWATLLAQIPTGEHQYYTAQSLQRVYEANEASEANLEVARQMAIDGFQTVLDDFPDSLSFTVTLQPIRLATLAYIGITELNAEPLGDWVLVNDAAGNPVAVRPAGVDTLRPGAEDE